MRRTLLLAAAATGIFLIPGAAEALQLDREHPVQLWRWLTCHATHASWEHLIWDVAVFVALGAFCERIDACRFWICLGAAAMAIPAGVLAALPQIDTYRGLSGLDSALFGLAAAHALRTPARWAALVLIAGFAAKVAVETLTGTTVFVDAESAGFVPVPLAHAVGFAVGLAAGIPAISATRIPIARALREI